MEKHKKIFYGKIEELLKGFKEDEKEYWSKRINLITVKCLDSWDFIIHQLGCKCLSAEDISEALVKCRYRKGERVQERAIRERAGSCSKKILDNVIKEIANHLQGVRRLG